ncbi:hypothetical protein E2C01_030651 [Portunus trituberculatus]|uniref:Uncharacterized protein n=1 Tax=Portunus trituberculatus TaxID=210409 RepID=A0A5B7EVE6_PORTR|nr:hypothetical protein [Portunus trituberculatus]
MVVVVVVVVVMVVMVVVVVMVVIVVVVVLVQRRSPHGWGCGYSLGCDGVVRDFVVDVGGQYSAKNTCEENSGYVKMMYEYMVICITPPILTHTFRRRLWCNVPYYLTKTTSVPALYRYKIK